MERTRLIAGIVLVMLIGAALIYVVVRDAGDADQPTTATEASASAESPAPAEEAEPSPDPEAVDETEREPIAVPTPDTTGRDFDQIFREIVTFRDWLFANPDPDLLRLIYHPECDCYDSAHRTLTYLVEHDLHFDSGGFVVLEVDIAEEFESAVRVRVTVNRVEHTVLNDEGEEVNVVDGAGAATFSFSLIRESRGWVVRTVAQVSE